jgi:tetratricopeptide (TPR) repeat protein
MRNLAENSRARLFQASIFIALLIGAMLSSTLMAQNLYTQEELRALPRVCLAQRFVHLELDRPLVSASERKQWEERLGASDYLHFHHHCHALILAKRALSAARETERQGYFKEAVANFEYVQRNASSAFPLLPEVYLQKGLTLRMIGGHAEAAREFLGAIKLKPSYTPAYAALIDYYIDMGEIEEARRVLDTGLAHAPSSKILTTKRAQIEALAINQR